MKILKKAFSFLIAFVLLLTWSLFQFDVLARTIKEADVRGEDGRYLGRPFDPAFDLMFDDFNRSTITGIAGTGLKSATNEGSEVYITDYHLVANYSNQVGTTKEEPIYKVASPVNTEGAYQYLVFEMRGYNGASINDLILSFRYDDKFYDIDVPFVDLYGPDYDALPELTDEYQTYVIDVTSSLDGKTFVNIEDESITVDASSAIVGFHFMSDPETDGSGTLEIRRVYWSKTPNPEFSDSDPNYALLDRFDRERVEQGGENIYWRGGSPESKIVGKWLAFDYTNQKAVYEAIGEDNTNADETYKNVVLRIKGTAENQDLLMTPIYSDESRGEAKALSTLKGPDQELVPALTTEFQNLVINFEANGWNKDVIGFRFESKADEEGLIYIAQVFFTNMEYDASSIDTTYPILDPNDLVVFDDFNREELGATTDYDPNNPVALANGMLYIIAYNGIQRMSVENGALVFDATNTESNFYMQYTAAASERVNDGSYRYVVFKVKGTNGASLNNFRLQTIDMDDKRSEVRWAHGELLSGNQLPTPPLDAEDYPYVTEDGWMYLIVDLALSQLTTTVRGFDLFYSGDGKLYIDTIFFANRGPVLVNEEEKVVFDDFNRDELAPADPPSAGKYWFDTNARLEDNALVLDAVDDAYVYYRTAGPVNNADQPKRYLLLTMKGSEGTTLESFRLSMIKGSDVDEPRFYNQGQLVSAPGVVIPELTTEYQVYVIDLEASGLTVDAEGISIFFGGWDSGTLYIKEIAFADALDIVELIEEKLAELAEEPEEPEDPQEEEPHEEEPEDPEDPEDPGQNDEHQDKDEKGGLRALYITLIVIGSVAVLGAGGFFGYRLLKKRSA